MTENIEKLYNSKIKQEIFKEFSHKSIMQVPKISKVVINAGVNDAINDSKAIENVSEELALITGQKPLVTKAKKSIATFKLREGMPIGLKVTLRNKKMYDFLDKLINVALPRVRDFRGLSKKSIDSQGNYSLGIKEQIIFPEIDYDKIKKIRGFDITIVTTTTDKKEALFLLTKIGIPFEKGGTN
uniref:50S ribosomal protein L5 n=1 Tax=Spiroplasma endosymbiont of Amphibalanus improvisus TaxID=3066327 RepID=UPI00313BA1B8